MRLIAETTHERDFADIDSSQAISAADNQQPVRLQQPHLHQLPAECRIVELEYLLQVSQRYPVSLRDQLG